MTDDLEERIGPPTDERGYAIRYPHVEPPILAHARSHHLREMLALIHRKSEEENESILESVRECITRSTRIVRAGGHVPVQLVQDLADDVCIWFAYEIVAGRGREHFADAESLANASDVTKMPRIEMQGRMRWTTTKKERRARR